MKTIQNMLNFLLLIRDGCNQVPEIQENQIDNLKTGRKECLEVDSSQFEPLQWGREEGGDIFARHTL